MATKKPDALTLWTHLGPLAEAMRAAPVRMTPAAYCAASMDTCLQDDGTVVTLDRDARVYAAGKAPYARMWLDGDTLVLRFQAPKDKTDVDMAYFKPATPKGWLEYRRPATRDPKPDLAANIGSVLGQASFERRPRK